jgi:hypothetical protein
MHHVRNLLAILCLLAVMGASAAERPRLAFTIICEDTVLAQKLRSGISARLRKASIDISDKAPLSKLILYVIRDVNSTKNAAGVTVAIAHVSNIEVLALASETVDKKKEQPSRFLVDMLGEDGFIHHLNAAHLDGASDREVGILLDSVVATFLQKNSRNKG